MVLYAILAFIGSIHFFLIKLLFFSWRRELLRILTQTHVSFSSLKPLATEMDLDSPSGTHNFPPVISQFPFKHKLHEVLMIRGVLYILQQYCLSYLSLISSKILFPIKKKDFVLMLFQYPSTTPGKGVGWLWNKGFFTSGCDI